MLVVEVDVVRVRLLKVVRIMVIVFLCIRRFFVGFEWLFVG